MKHTSLISGWSVETRNRIENEEKKAKRKVLPATKQAEQGQSRLDRLFKSFMD